MRDRAMRPFSELVQLVAERTVGAKDSSLPYIGLEHIPSAGSWIREMGRAADSISTNGVFRAGDILFGKLRPRLRKCVRVDTSGYCSTDILVLRASNEVDAAFSGFVAQSETVFQAAIRTEEGTKMPRCSWNDLKKVRVFCPPTPREQKRIAEILGSLETAIENTEALIDKYRQIKAGLMQDLFTRGVLPNGHLRPPREEAPELYRESSIGWIPKGWELSGLAARGRPGTDWIRTGPFGSALKGEHWREHGHPVITIGALGVGDFLESELLFVDEKDAARLGQFQVVPDDVVFSRVADVGRSVVIRDQHNGWIMSSNLMRIALDRRLARPDFLQMLLAGDSRVKSQIKASVNSGGRDVANSEVLNRLQLAWPKPDEQDRVISACGHVTSRLHSESSILVKLRAQRDGLMQDLLTGKVPVKVDEPAAEPADA